MTMCTVKEIKKQSGKIANPSMTWNQRILTECCKHFLFAQEEPFTEPHPESLCFGSMQENSKRVERHNSLE